MTRKLLLALVASLCVALPASPARAAVVTGGETTVTLAYGTLNTFGIVLTGTTGTLSGNDIVFPIVGGDFSFTPGTLLPVDATTSIDHAGTIDLSIIDFDASPITVTPVTVGDFSIGFDAARASGTTTGFFVESTTGLEAILFDVATPPVVDEASSSALLFGGDLAVSPELAGVLVGAGLPDLTGAVVGSAFVSATAVPEPSAVSLAGIAIAAAGFGLVRRRRRSG